MNHLKAVFKEKDGSSFAYHTWEIRRDGYRQIALVLSDPFLPVEHNQRLIEFLLEKYFKVYAPDMPGLGRYAAQKVTIDSYKKHMESFLAFLKEREKKFHIIPIVFSFSALPFLHYFFNASHPMKVLVLVSPVLDINKVPVKKTICFKKAASLDIKKEDLSGDSTEIKTVENFFFDEFRASKKLIKHSKKNYSEFPGTLPLESSNAHIGLFTGEADTLVCMERIERLKSLMNEGNCKVFTYPRVKHLIFFDRYRENALKDLSFFIDSKASFL